MFILLNNISLESKQLNSASSGEAQSNSIFVGLDGQVLDMGEQSSFFQYKLRYSNDNRVFIDVAPLHLEVKDEYSCFGAEILSFEYRNDYDLNEQREFIFNMIDVAGKIRTPLNEYSRSTKKSYIDVGVNGGFGTLGQDIQWGQYHFTDDMYSNTNNIYAGYNVKYGLDISKQSNVEIGVSGAHRWVVFDYYTSPEDKLKYTSLYDAETLEINQRDKERAVWEAEKYQWEIDNGYANSIEDKRYVDLSGADPKPAALDHKVENNDYMQRLNRKTFALQPQVSYLHTFKNNNSLKIYANAKFYVYDKLEGSVAKHGNYSSALSATDFVNEDLKKSIDMNNFRIGLVFTFGR